MKNNIVSLLRNFLEGNATPEEIARINKWYDKEEGTEKLSIKNDQLKEKMYHQILGQLAARGKLVPLYRRPFFRIAIASCLILLLSMVAYYFFENKNDRVVDLPGSVKEINAPGTNRATITLSNGNTLYLDSAVNGELIVEQNMSLKKLANGQVSYEPINEKNADKPVYNTLTNPRGSKLITIRLSDSSRVWLNSESSITYPVAFIGNERKITMTGEAYFEITHDKTKPFYVSNGDVQVNVLGTHFNVNTYEDEDAIRVTLLEGSVEVKNQRSKIKLKPGEQAESIHHSSFIIHHSPGLDEVMAWKNGLFSFSHDNIKTVMRQLQRWYDLDVSFEGNITTDKFGGDISRNAPLKKVLEMLKASQVNFEVKGNKVIVKP